MMTENGISLADIAAVTKNNEPVDGYGMNGLWNNPFIYLIWMWAMRSFNGWGENGAAMQGALTRSDIYEGFNTNDILRKLDDNSYRVSDGFHTQTTSMLQGFNGIQQDLCQGFNNTQRGVMEGFYATQGAIAENRYAQQQCCCEIERQIEGVRAENYRNTCDITTAIHADGEATRALINANILQGLRDKLEEKDRELQQANYLNSQIEQTSKIVQILRPTPIPAYVTSSPFQSTGVGCGCNAFA